MSEVLVTGGNGFVGRHLVAALLGRGDGVRVLALPAEDTCWLAKRGVQVYRGDVRQPDTLVAPMREVTSVLHLAAMMDVWRPLRDYHAVNVTGTENVCRTAQAAGVRRIVHMSSSSVYGSDHQRPVDESCPLTPFKDPYPVTKAAGDLAVQRMVTEDGLPAVIVRPDQIFGPGDHLHFWATADRLARGRGVIVGTGDNAVPLVFVSDAVAGILLALDRDNVVGQAYNITNDRPITQRQYMDAIAREIAASPTRIHVPYRAVYAMGYLGERLAWAVPSWHRPPVTRLGVAFLGMDSRFEIGKARRELGYDPQVDLLDGIRITARWYLRRGQPGPVRLPVADQDTEGATN